MCQRTLLSLLGWALELVEVVCGPPPGLSFFDLVYSVPPVIVAVCFRAVHAIARAAAVLVCRMRAQLRLVLAGMVDDLLCHVGKATLCSLRTLAVLQQVPAACWDVVEPAMVQYGSATAWQFGVRVEAGVRVVRALAGAVQRAHRGAEGEHVHGVLRLLVEEVAIGRHIEWLPWNEREGRVLHRGGRRVECIQSRRHV